MVAIIILSILLPVIVSLLFLCLAKCSSSTKEDATYYDENGNHIYYDRKLIAQLEREKKQMGQ